MNTNSCMYYSSLKTFVDPNRETEINDSNAAYCFLYKANAMYVLIITHVRFALMIKHLSEDNKEQNVTVRTNTTYNSIIIQKILGGRKKLYGFQIIPLLFFALVYSLALSTSAPAFFRSTFSFFSSISSVCKGTRYDT